ncbi:hypothetical protein OIO90_004190 [Microbotryomycetes sp. JL221]|nr:hypothetical protein OIO90_004190 [Microbotryomycetes sp. JL221]
MSTVHKFESEPRPFKIEISDKELEELQDRLDRTRWPLVDCVPDDFSDDERLNMFGCGPGPTLELMKELVNDWRHKYDWRKAEAELNKLPHFKVNIEGLNLHFIHQKSTRQDAIPLILCHGWPGSFDEFTHIIPLLTNPPSDKDLAFHVVVPSQPGFTFSDPPRSHTHTMDDTARMFDKLMTGLGYETYAAQGGDWGSVTARLLGSTHQQHCRAVHLNFLPVLNPLMKIIPPRLLIQYLPNFLLPPLERERGKRALDYLEKGSSYYAMQHNTPRTPAYGLNDSPVGLLAWIAEKMISYIDMASQITKPQGPPTLTRDALFNHVSLYWFTHSIGTSFSPYAFNRHFAEFVSDSKYFLPNLGISIFPWEIVVSALKDMKRTGNVKWYKEADQGGHYAALENPHLLAEHLRDAFKVLW